jgi:hypothetical protein
LDAIAESFSEFKKWELIFWNQPWRRLDGVELPMVIYIKWFKNRRFHGEIEPGAGFTTAGKFEAAYCRLAVHAGETASQESRPSPNPGGSRRFDSRWMKWRYTPRITPMVPPQVDPVRAIRNRTTHGDAYRGARRRRVEAAYPLLLGISLGINSTPRGEPERRTRTTSRT